MSTNSVQTLDLGPAIVRSKEDAGNFMCCNCGSTAVVLLVEEAGMVTLKCQSCSNHRVFRLVEVVDG